MQEPAERRLSELTPTKEDRPRTRSNSMLPGMHGAWRGKHPLVQAGPGAAGVTPRRRLVQLLLRLVLCPGIIVFEGQQSCSHTRACPPQLCPNGPDSWYGCNAI